MLGILRVSVTVGFSKFFMETKKDIPGYGWGHNRALTLYFKDFNPYFDPFKVNPGYRSGVILVSIPKGILPGLRSRVIKVCDRTEFVTVCKPRIEGETPRKKTMALVDSLPLANYVTAVLYNKDVLAEDNDRSTDCDWEIVALLTQVDEEEPMAPSTLMSNHFKADGGTATNMTPEQFEQALRTSYNYWKGRSIGMTREEWRQYR